MQQLLGKNSLEVGKTLYSLVGNGMLISGNKGRWTYYSLNSEYLGYSDKYRMKRFYIDPLLGEVLTMTSIESKTDPKQKYVVKKKLVMGCLKIAVIVPVYNAESTIRRCVVSILAQT